MNILYILLLSLFINIDAYLSIPFDELEKSFQSGDASAIVAQSRDKVLINVNDKEGVYGASQARQVLKDFFTNHPPKGFVFTFKGKEAGSNSFALGLYTSENKKFRVSIKFTLERDDYKIESITIEPESE
jgi:hypothetical protein